MVKQSSCIYFNDGENPAILMTIDGRMHNVLKFLFYENGNPPKNWRDFLRREQSVLQGSENFYYVFSALLKEYTRFSDPDSTGVIAIQATISFRGKTKDFLGFSGIDRVGNPLSYSDY